MPFSQTPGDLFAGMSEDGTNLTIPIAALAAHGLTAANADATTGDPRAVARAFVARIEEWYRDLAEADRPQAQVASARISVVSLTAANFAGTQKEEITITTYLDRPDNTVSDEPA